MKGVLIVSKCYGDYYGDNRFVTKGNTSLFSVEDTEKGREYVSDYVDSQGEYNRIALTETKTLFYKWDESVDDYFNGFIVEECPFRNI